MIALSCRDSLRAHIYYLDASTVVYVIHSSASLPNYEGAFCLRSCELRAASSPPARIRARDPGELRQPCSVRLLYTRRPSSRVFTLAMSDSERDASVLGKRARNGEGAENDHAEEPERHDPNAMDADDDSDDDVGPMPMPAGTEGRVVKKKRKGACSASRSVGSRVLMDSTQSSRTRSSTSSIFPARTGTTRVSCTGMS